MILISIPGSGSTELTQMFGAFPIYLTEKNVGFPNKYPHGSLMNQISNLLYGYPKHEKLTATRRGENILVVETASEGIFGGARSTGDHEYNAARTADYRDGHNIHIRNPRLPDDLQPLTVLGGDSSSGDESVNRARKVTGTI